MVDNRSAGSLGISGGFNFKAGDPSGSAAKMSDEKMGQDTGYFFLQKGEDEGQQAPVYVDRSAQLNATLNSLAMANVAGILKNIKKSNSGSKIVDGEDDDSVFETEEKSRDSIVGTTKVLGITNIFRDKNF